jgi:tetratricopeptide (TPR) repeat protein
VRRAAPGAVALALVLAPLLWGSLAAAQDDRAIRIEQGLPLLGPPGRTTAAAVAPALTAEQLKSVATARELRRAGKFDQARQTLETLRAAVPHHPTVLAELAALGIERKDWLGVERLARSERLAQRDSTVLSRELVLVLEQLSRWRDAAQVVAEDWTAAPGDQDWASAALERASVGDSRGTRDVMRRAAERNPARADLARGYARLEWRAGDVRPAIRALAAADRAQGRWRLRWSFADEMLAAYVGRDSSGAIEVLLDLAADGAADASFRNAGAQRAWEVFVARGTERDGATRLAKALGDLPNARWSPTLRLAVARELREAGHTAEARQLLASSGGPDALPDFRLERALTDLREGPPERVLPEMRALAEGSPDAAYRYAEALFFAAQFDSAHAWYTRAANDPSAPAAGAALERLFLIEEASPRTALPAFGRIAYSEWRGDRVTFRALADSLYRALPRGGTWAQAALLASTARADDPRAALEPLLAVADSLPGDRLAPIARQRAGDLYHTRLDDPAEAAKQYEECLARYPRAWNAAEVRRRLEQLKSGRL